MGSGEVNVQCIGSRLGKCWKRFANSMWAQPDMGILTVVVFIAVFITVFIAVVIAAV